MNPHSNLYTLSYKINSINYYAILLKNNVFLLKNADGKILDINQKDKDTFKELLDKIQKQKYKFIKYIDYKGQRIKEYLNQLDGLLYFTVEQNGKELACSYNDYPDLYNQANFMKKNNLSGETTDSNDGQNSEQWKILENLSMQNVSTEVNQQEEMANKDESLPGEMPIELVKSLDANSKKIQRKFPWIKKATKMFVTIALSASIALSITACGNTHRTDLPNLDPDSAVIYQIDNIGNNHELNAGIIEDILRDNGFDNQTIDNVVDDYETRLGVNISDSHDETDLSDETTKQAIDAIDNNDNLSESDKSFLREMFAPWISANSAYLDEHCIDRLANLKIIYNTEEGAAQKYGASGFTGTLLDDGTIARYSVFHNNEPGLLGIVVNDVNPDSMKARSTLSHEFVHVLMPKWREGMVELYNPIKQNGNVYKQQQLAMAMLQEIYGETTLKETLLHDDTLSTLAKNEDEANLFRTILYCMPSGFGSSGVGLAGLIESIENLYETKHPEEKASENTIFILCKDILNGTNTSGIAEEGESIDYFVYKGDKLYVACTYIAQNNSTPILEALGLQETQYAQVSRLIPIE